MIPKRVQNIVDNIAEEFRRRFSNEANLIWFGSWMKGTADKHSDIDLAIDHQTAALNQQDLIAFRDWIEDLPTLYSIDLIDMNTAGEQLKEEINRYGKQL